MPTLVASTISSRCLATSGAIKASVVPRAYPLAQSTPVTPAAKAASKIASAVAASAVSPKDMVPSTSRDIGTATSSMMIGWDSISTS